jgi:hypothetical protein
MNFLHKISNFRNQHSKVKNVIISIPKSWRTPPENYIEPEMWSLKFPQPSQVRLRAFLNSNKSTQLGPSDKVDKDKDYKNPEYFSYHPFSFYNMEEDLNCKRCRPQPSNKSNIIRDSNEKCP